MGNLSPWRTVTAVVRGKVRMPSESQPYADGRQPDQDRQPVADRLDDDHFPAYTMGRAAELVGATPAFLRALGEARLITPTRSEGGHRRYSRHQLRLAARARELVDQGTPVDAACRIVSLEDQLEQAERTNEELRGRVPTRSRDTAENLSRAQNFRRARTKFLSLNMPSGFIPVIFLACREHFPC